MNDPNQALLDRLGRPFDPSGGVPPNTENPNHDEKRAMQRELRAFRRRAAKERDRRASRTPKPRRPGHPGVRRGVPTFQEPIGSWIRGRLHNLEGL